MPLRFAIDIGLRLASRPVHVGLSSALRGTTDYYTVYYYLYHGYYCRNLSRDLWALLHSGAPGQGKFRRVTF